ncbi:cation transporter [Sulfuricurvum sp.]|uniref:cation transporter n=1 Tax=Sulfuricurvum sp. TaxID=2025608 RepID=UPI0026284179|nr:cation transporter [Sulfuricurvum sp.]MDD2784109.1 cation transporter [Sulfuricurvum sp.]MDD3594894.1 cation transporter [Sulfuricurvum sp.]
MHTFSSSFKKVVFLVAILNFAYFWVEYGVALKIGSVSLFADSIDFLEDTAINVLILIAIGWSAHRRSQLGLVLAGIILIPSISTLWMVWQKFLHPIAPDPSLLSFTGLGALIVNVTCAFLLVNFRKHTSSLAKAAFLSARNDAYANIAIIASGLMTIYSASMWPDLVVGIGIFAMNLDAAKAVFKAAKKEKQALNPLS